ncbi:hypothetical protein P8452_58028 [Trifolium repens]|nr:hypothetical protein P8452_58028 [Trifolium repens]
MEEKSNSSHPSEKSMEHNGNVMEEFKSPDPINSSKKSMEDQVIAMEESKFSDPIKPREKTMEDQVIDMEESKFSDPINLSQLLDFLTLAENTVDRCYTANAIAS